MGNMGILGIVIINIIYYLLCNQNIIKTVLISIFWSIFTYLHFMYMLRYHVNEMDHHHIEMRVGGASPKLSTYGKIVLAYICLFTYPLTLIVFNAMNIEMNIDICHHISSGL